MAQATHRNIAINKIKGLASILRPDKLQYSPVNGVLMWSSPRIIANLRKFPETNNGKIANMLFYQREDNSGRAFGPLGGSKSRSNVGYWLKPYSLGYILGLGTSDRMVEGKLSNKAIDEELQQIGIKCNLVDDNWTGISLERFRRLIALIVEDQQRFVHRRSPSEHCIGGFSVPLLLCLLLEKAHDKNCMLHFLLGIENGLKKEIIAAKHAPIRSSDSAACKCWLEAEFNESDLSSEAVSMAANELLNANITLDVADAAVSEAFGRNYETVAASLVRERAFKPSVRLGRFSIDDGPIKPDCVEVVIREVVEGLIFVDIDKNLNRLRSDLIPDAAHEGVRQLYDTPSSSTAISSVITKHNRTNSVIDGDEIGERWFHYCSQLPDCEYLSETSAGKKYELKPKLANVCRVLGLLLANQSGWSKLSQLQEFWNAHMQQKGSEGNHAIECKDSINSFRAPLSDTEMIHREIGNIRLCDRNHELMLELEAAHGLAAVQHRRCLTVKSCWDGSEIFSLYLAKWNDYCVKQTLFPLDNQEFSCNWFVLFSAVLSDQLLCISNSNIADFLRQSISPAKQLNLISVALFSARWGSLTEYLQEAAIDSSGNMVMADGALTNASNSSAETKLVNQAIAALNVMCGFASHYEEILTNRSHNGQLQNSFVELLVWYLRRGVAPIMDILPQDQLASQLLRLPMVTRNDPRIRDAVKDLTPKCTGKSKVENIAYAVIYSRRDLYHMSVPSILRAAFIFVKAKLV